MDNDSNEIVKALNSHSGQTDLRACTFYRSLIPYATFIDNALANDTLTLYIYIPLHKFGRICGYLATIN